MRWRGREGVERDLITDLDEFLRSRPDDSNLDLIDDIDEQEKLFTTLHGIAYLEKEGRDYTEFSGIEEILGDDVAPSYDSLWHFEAQRRLAQVLQDYVLYWVEGYEVTIRRQTSDTDD